MKDRNENRPGYKKTKVGWIPEGWHGLHLGSLCIENSGIKTGPFGSQLHTSDYVDSGIPVIMPTNMLAGRVSKTQLSKISEEKAQQLKAQRCQTGDILFARRGELGRCVLITESETGFLNGTGCIRVRLQKSKVYPMFMINFFSTTYTKKWLERNAVGQTMLNLNAEIISAFPVALPPLPEQKKIAEILSTWDETIDHTRKLIDAKKCRKKALMQQLITGKKRLPGIKKEWETYRLSELLKQISRRVEFDDQYIYDLISVRRRSGGVFSRGKIPGHTILTKQMYLAKKDDFLISKMQIVHGASALVTEKFDSKHISGSYIALRVRNSQKLDVDFLNWLSKTPYFYHLTYLASYGVHIEKMTFNLRLFLKSKISIPRDIKEQRRIAEFLSTADEEIETLGKKLAALEKQKRGLMQKLLTGEVRVTV